jgi:hypothetical protein
VSLGRVRAQLDVGLRDARSRRRGLGQGSSHLEGDLAFADVVLIRRDAKSHERVREFHARDGGAHMWQ